MTEKRKVTPEKNDKYEKQKLLREKASLNTYSVKFKSKINKKN